MVLVFVKRYVLFFQGIGVPEEIALSVSLLFFFLVTISSLIGGLFWLMERRDIMKLSGNRLIESIVGMKAQNMIHPIEGGIPFTFLKSLQMNLYLLLSQRLVFI